MAAVEGEGSADDSPMGAAPDPLERSAAAAKTQKRKFTGWTHQDEQSFFSALRKVGKNFDKITVRVQGKNRGQVRDYYYRLIRRLNKLLGPGFSLDVKNSKETIAAMLRWWSLLEKFGCRASKLHLKPHIYNKFVQTLGNDLLKDRKRTKINHLPGDIHMSSQSPYLCKSQGSVFLPVKVMAADAQDFSKTPVSKEESLKQIVEPKSNALRTTKQKRRSGTGMNHTREEDPQPFAKLKLQLFPINEDTKKALEKGEHNPHLELILSSRKKISTVVEHLNKKWGSPNNESGEFMLFPYSAETEDLTTYQQWTMEDNATIADVFLSVNSPSIFRLKYGWFPLVEFQAGVSEINYSHFNNLMIHGDIKSKCKDTLEDDCMPEQRPDNPEHQSMLVCDMPSGMRRDVALPEKSINTHSSQCDRQKQIHSSGAIPEEEWEDTLTNIGMGYLLAETSGGVVPDCLDPFLDKNDLQNRNFDSSDDAIASHNSCWQSATMPENVYPAILGPEEACDVFLFGLAADWKQECPIDSSNSPVATYHCNSDEFQDFLQVYTSQNLAVAETAKDPLINGIRDAASSADSLRRLENNAVLQDCSLYDMRWPDLFESLDCEMTSSNYQDCDIVFADSCILESSLDSSGNLPFFSMDNNSCIPFADI